MDTWHKSYERYDVITPPALPAPNSSSKFASMAHAIQQQDSQVALNIENRYNYGIHRLNCFIRIMEKLWQDTFLLIIS